MKVKKDGRPFGTTRVLVEPDFDLHPDYALNEALRKITKHGRLDVLAVYLKADPAFAFTARWDEPAQRLDVDPPDSWSRTRQRRFRQGRDGYGGHHPEPLPDRHFAVNLQVPGLTIFRGVVSLACARELHLEGDTLRLTGGLATFKVGRDNVASGA